MKSFPSLLLLVVTFAAGCQPGNETQNDDGPQQLRVDGATFPLTISDHLGRKVTLPKRPTRIISVAPSNTEILFAIGAGKQVVGVTSYCNYPPQTAPIAKVGQFSANSIDIEQIVQREPDLVLTSGSMHQPLIERLASLGITAVALEPRTIDAVIQTIELAGRITGHVERADEVAGELSARINKARQIAEQIPENDRRRVYLEVARNPLISIGRTSFLAEQIRLTGGENIFADLDEGFPAINYEAILARDPEVILLLSHGDDQAILRDLEKRPGWQEISAVREGRVYLLTSDLIVRGGPRLPLGIEQIAGAVYPERFGSSKVDALRLPSRHATSSQRSAE